MQASALLLVAFSCLLPCGRALIFATNNDSNVSTTVTNTTTTTINYNSTTVTTITSTTTTGTTTTSTTTTNTTTTVNTTTSTSGNTTTATTTTGEYVDPNATVVELALDVPYDPNATHNATWALDVSLNYTTLTTRTSTTSTIITFTTTYNGTTSTTEYQWTTSTTTTTTTLGKECDVPYDPAGNYTLRPYSWRDNSSWVLKCNDTYFPSLGLTLASCLGNGVMRSAGVCMKSGCSGSMASSRYGTTCDQGQMDEGSSCTVKCNPDWKQGEVLGYWTCIRGMLWGSPTCLNREAKHWVVAWVLPTVMGGFDFKGTMDRNYNFSNSTFRYNTSWSLADSLTNVQQSHFAYFTCVHIWESADEFHPDTGELLTFQHTHWFSVTYSLLVWDVNTLHQNFDGLNQVLKPDSDVYASFEKLMLQRANITLTELFPTNMPITFNDTVLAPDSELTDGAHSIRLDMRLFLFVAALYSFLSYPCGIG